MDEPEITEPMTPVAFGNNLMRLMDTGRLVFDQRAMGSLAAAVGICTRDGCLRELWNRLDYLTRNERDRITLHPDGQPAEMSFNILWHERPLSFEYADGQKFYGEVKADAKPFMVGGLIYHGKERGHGDQHTWGVHT
jgi:hypothetical protein